MIRILLLLAAILLALAATSCTSPLESDAPRIETPLTPAPKVVPSHVETEFTFGEMEYSMLPGQSFQLDTTTNPVRFWMDFSMEQTNSGVAALIQRFRLHTDSLSADGYTYNLRTGQAWLTMDLGQGVEEFDVNNTIGYPNTATVLIIELPQLPGKPRSFQVTVFLEGNKGSFVPGYPEQQVLGRFVVTV